jgi:hypothetical protein
MQKWTIFAHAGMAAGVRLCGGWTVTDARGETVGADASRSRASHSQARGGKLPSDVALLAGAAIESRTRERCPFNPRQNPRTWGRALLPGLMMSGGNALSHDRRP